MAAPGPIQMTVVSLAEQGRSHGIRHSKLDAWRSGRPTPLGEAPASGLAAVTLNRTRYAATTPRSRTTAAVTDERGLLRIYWLVAALNLAASWAGTGPRSFTSASWAVARWRPCVVFCSLAGPRRPPPG